MKLNQEEKECPFCKKNIVSEIFNRKYKKYLPSIPEKYIEYLEEVKGLTLDLRICDECFKKRFKLIYERLYNEEDLHNDIDIKRIIRERKREVRKRRQLVHLAIINIFSILKERNVSELKIERKYLPELFHKSLLTIDSRDNLPTLGFDTEMELHCFYEYFRFKIIKNKIKFVFYYIFKKAKIL